MGIRLDFTHNPDQLRADLEAMLEEEAASVRGNPDREAKVWLEKLAEVDQERRGYSRLAAKGRITDENLDRELVELEETRTAAERELEALRDRRERIEQMEYDRDTLLDYMPAWRLKPVTDSRPKSAPSL